jgi:hypothetical protein
LTIIQVDRRKCSGHLHGQANGRGVAAADSGGESAAYYSP